MIAGTGFTAPCQCGMRYSTSAGSDARHASWCPAYSQRPEMAYIYAAGPCESCKRLTVELTAERAARKDAERRLRFIENRSRR